MSKGKGRLKVTKLRDHFTTVLFDAMDVESISMGSGNLLTKTLVSTRNEDSGLRSLGFLATTVLKTLNQGDTMFDHEGL